MTGSNIQAPAYQREVTVLAQSAATLALTHLGHGLDQSPISPLHAPASPAMWYRAVCPLPSKQH